MIQGEELMEALKEGCKAFWVYKEDFELKDFFFEEISTLKNTWTCYADEPDRQVYTKPEKGLGLLTVFYRFKVPTSMYYPISLMNEIDLMKEWIPGIVMSRAVKKCSDYRLVFQGERSFPWPMANRELFIHASAMFIKEKKGALVMLRSSNDERANHWDVDVPAENP